MNQRTGARSLVIRIVIGTIIVIIACTAFGIGVCVQGYLYFTDGLSSLEKLKSYEPAIVTEVLAKNGDIIGEFCNQRRYVVPFEEIPKALPDAMVSVYGPSYWKPERVDVKTTLYDVIKILSTGDINRYFHRTWPPIRTSKKSHYQ